MCLAYSIVEKLPGDRNVFLFNFFNRLNRNTKTNNKINTNNLKLNFIKGVFQIIMCDDR